MYQKDYILRIIEMAGRMVASLLGLIRKGDLSKASENLDNLYYDILKQDAAFFRDIPEEKLTETLLKEHDYTNGHLEILAELFYAEAELCNAKKDNSGCIQYSGKSLRLFEFIDHEQKTYSAERIKKMDELKIRLSDIHSRNNK